MPRPRFSFGSHHTGNIKNIKKQKKKFPKVAKEVVTTSDIILQVLDARFIDETRNFELEALIKRWKDYKKLIYVVNKIDLVDQKKTEKEFKKVLRPVVFISSKTGKGVGNLRKLIRIEAKRVPLSEDKKKVEVGIIGYPNTGKSTLINRITRRTAAKTSKQAGHTKGMQKIKMTDKITVLDTPGVIPEAFYSTTKRDSFANDAKLGARTYSDVKYPEDIVHHIMKKHSDDIERFYKIDSKGDSQLLIELLGKEKNFLVKAGKTDIDRTARQILRDWQEGKIKVG